MEFAKIVETLVKMPRYVNNIEDETQVNNAEDKQGNTQAIHMNIKS